MAECVCPSAADTICSRLRGSDVTLVSCWISATRPVLSSVAASRPSLLYLPPKTNHYSINTYACMRANTHTQTVLRLSGLCLGQPKWASTTGNIHPLKSIVVISHHPLSASSIYYDPWHPRCSIYVSNSLYPQSLSKFSLVYLLAWHLPLHTPYNSSPNHCLLFAAHAHTIVTCFAVVPKLCHLIPRPSWSYILHNYTCWCTENC